MNRQSAVRLDTTQTSPVSLWLAEYERLLYLIFSESNFYNLLHRHIGAMDVGAPTIQRSEPCRR
jgi:hypothetical protein